MLFFDFGKIARNRRFCVSKLLFFSMLFFCYYCYKVFSIFDATHTKIFKPKLQSMPGRTKNEQKRAFCCTKICFVAQNFVSLHRSNQIRLP